MALTTNFNAEPYYDDYNADNAYYRILFRPGFAVQAREVTQLQTILQKQVERHGSHTFQFVFEVWSEVVLLLLLEPHTQA